MCKEKTVLLAVTGDGDYSASDFSQKYSAQEEYEKMLKEGVTEKDVVVYEHKDNKFPPETAHLEILEFGPVDPSFIKFVREFWADYDSCKQADAYLVESIEEG